MNKTLKIREINDVVIIEPVGKLTRGSHTDAIRRRVWGFLESNRKKLVLNLQSVTHLDSSSVGELVAAYSNAVRMGSELKLVKSPWVKEVLSVASLYSVFDVFRDERSAIRSFAAQSPLRSAAIAS